jgi:penicillin-binding protein 1A
VKKLLLWMEILFILVLGAGVGVVAGAFYQISKVLPPQSYLRTYKTPEGTTIWASDGKTLLARLANENREPVPLERIPKVMQDAIISIEDARFYQHAGLDFRGLVRALWLNVRGGDLTQQGGSTLTQQLARNIYLTRAKTVARKIKETLLAVQIERSWTKQQILEMYLNQVYFGSQAYGVQSAAKVYFDKDVRELTLAEAATLAGLPQRPSMLSPYDAKARTGSYDVTVDRRNLVLQRMAELGYITPAKARETMKLPLKLAHKKPPQLGGYYRAKHFVDYVVTQLRETYGDDLLFKGGLRVVTTLNWPMQKEAERAAKSGLARYGRTYRISECALVAVEPATGYVRAMVGGVQEPWEKYQFNCAAQARRSPGSSFKAFVYATALERGWTPYRAVSTYVKPIKDGNKWWQPKNHGKSGGALPLVSAFANSVNTAAVNLNLQVGPANVVEMAHRLGIQSKLLAVPSLALGTSEVSVLEMAAAYSVFANKGNRAEPQCIAKITNPDGSLIENNAPRVRRGMLTDETVRGMEILTRAVVTSGTGRAAGIVPNAHGKTGTGEEHKDLWFVGYTPELATAVWLGNRDNSAMRHIFGGQASAPIWADFMKEAVKIYHKNRKKPGDPKAKPGTRDKPGDAAADVVNDPDNPEPVPLGGGANSENAIRVRICADTDDLANPYCPNVETRDYLSGDQPKTRCTEHGPPPDAAVLRPRPQPMPRFGPAIPGGDPTLRSRRRRRSTTRRRVVRPDSTDTAPDAGDPLPVTPDGRDGDGQ